MQGVRKKLLARTAPGTGLLYVGELHGTTLMPKMDHLVCFLPGERVQGQTPTLGTCMPECLWCSAMHWDVHGW